MFLYRGLHNLVMCRICTLFISNWNSDLLLYLVLLSTIPLGYIMCKKKSAVWQCLESLAHRKCCNFQESQTCLVIMWDWCSLTAYSFAKWNQVCEIWTLHITRWSWHAPAVLLEYNGSTFAGATALITRGIPQCCLVVVGAWIALLAISDHQRLSLKSENPDTKHHMESISQLQLQTVVFN